MKEESLFKMLMESLLVHGNSTYVIYLLYVPFTLACIWASAVFIFSPSTQKLWLFIRNIIVRATQEFKGINTSPYDNAQWVDRVAPYISLSFNYIFALYFFVYAITIAGLLLTSEKARHDIWVSLTAIGGILILFVVSRLFKVAGDKDLYKIRSKSTRLASGCS